VAKPNKGLADGNNRREGVIDRALRNLAVMRVVGLGVRHHRDYWLRPIYRSLRLEGKKRKEIFSKPPAE